MGGLRFDWFMKGMVLAVLLAAVWPEPGARGGFLQPQWINRIGVALIFFFNGLALSLAAMRAGALNWRAHLLVQGATFVLFPLLGVVILRAAHGVLPYELQIGFFYLCALPSTVSSSVALTVAARGNVPVAVFNATLSSLIGVLLTPAWMAWILERSSLDFPVLGVIRDLALWVLLPLMLGQLARPWLGAWATRHRDRLQAIDRITILLLIYTSFADSVQQGVWSSFGPALVAKTLVGAVLLFFFVLLALSIAARLVGLSAEDRVAVLFCGSKKTLAAGVPMAQVIFASNPAIGLILMPLMLYHPLQLAVGGMLAQRWSLERRSADARR